MMYSRQNPSPRYRRLVAMYQQMHLHGDARTAQPAQKIFNGNSLLPQAPRIKRLIDRSSARRVLDYGSGKGGQYDLQAYAVEGEGQWDGVVSYWGVDEVVCFDPAFPPYSRLPDGPFDGVIATDVLEHCPEEDVDWILAEIFAYSTHFVYATIACYPARKHLPNGENAHCTIRPAEWWHGRFEQASAHRDVDWEVWLQKDSPLQGKKVEELRLASWSD